MKSLKKLLGCLVFTFLVMLLASDRVIAASIEEVISSKEVSIKSVPITNIMAYYQVNELFGEMYSGYGLDNCNENYTKCDIVNFMTGDTIENVAINYDYDADVKKVVDKIMRKVPEDGKIFYLNDVEMIKYVMDMVDYEGEEELNPIRYSSEYRKFIEYNNFIFEPRMGYDEDFASFKGGTAAFKYNDTIYGFADGIGIRYNYAVYVKDNETNIASAIKTRLSKYFDIVDVVKIEDMTLEEFLEAKYEYYRGQFNTCKTEMEEIEAVPNEERDENYFSRWSDIIGRCSYMVNYYSSADEYVDMLRESDFEGDNAPYDFLKDAEDYLYGIEFKSGLMMQVAVIKDSSKVFDEDVEIINTDTSSGVTISTDGVIPLDTLIEVARLTDGEEYDKIVNLLNATNIEMFDLKLFSKSADKYITKLDNGEFEVRLPISDALKGKNLIVYFVNSDDEIEEYEVTIDENYAVFTTNHFSIYTLAENPKAPTINNPQTADKLMIYIVILAISLMGIVSLVLYFKNRSIKNK